jgi:DNA modification methylase|tara:strand:- start:3935 stop:4840 length:906 start_codon:yes stop_codon:yes gene_type:complete
MQSNIAKNSLNQLLNVSYSITPENKSIENGTYHDYNRLNNLTSKEWLKFQKSWFIVNPKPRQKNLLFHPAKFPEELVENFIRFFTKEGQTVIDPMVGTGSTIISAMNTGRNAIGVELVEKYSNIAAERIQKTIHDRRSENHSRKGTVKLYNGDARLLNGLDIKDIDYCITSPPYWNILHEKGFETQKKRKENNYDVYYSKDTKDVGNIEDYTLFLNELKDIYQKIHDVLKIGGYLTVIVKNIKKGGKIYPLAWDLAKKLDFFTLKDEKIWCQDNVKLAPYGYGYSWVSNTVHNYCLIFKKE